MKLHFTIIVTFINAIMCTMLTVSMLDESFVPIPMFIFIWLLFMIGLYQFGKMVGSHTKKIKKIFGATIAVNIVHFLGAFLYQKWTFTFLTAIFILRIFLVLFLLIVVYFLFLYIQVEKKHRKKGRNLRIAEKESKSRLQILWEKRQPQEKKPNDITFELGISIDKDRD